MLSPDVQAEILSRFFSKGEKIRAIARALGLNRKSVARVVNRKSVVLGMTSSQRCSILDEYKLSLSELLKDDASVPAKVLLQRARDLGYEVNRRSTPSFLQI